MKKHIDTFKRLNAVMKDVNGDNRQIIKTLQDQIDYLMEFIAWNIGTTIGLTPDSAAGWQPRIRRMRTAKFKRSHSLAVCFTDTRDPGRRHNSDQHCRRCCDIQPHGSIVP